MGTITPPPGNLIYPRQVEFNTVNGKIHIVTLYVDTAAIVKPLQYQYANFKQGASTSNEDYTINVRKGDIVIWRGEPNLNPDDVVNISAIHHENGRMYFGRNHLRGNGDDPEIVIGTIKKGPLTSEPNDPKNIEKYSVFFTVIHNGVQRNGTFHIDPKLCANN